MQMSVVWFYAQHVPHAHLQNGLDARGVVPEQRLAHRSDVFRYPQQQRCPHTVILMRRGVASQNVSVHPAFYTLLFFQPLGLGVRVQGLGLLVEKKGGCRKPGLHSRLY